MQRKLLMNTRTGFNAEVYRHFKDVVDGDATTSASRKELRDSLLINNKDSRTTATFKIQYFRDLVQKVHEKVTVVGGKIKDEFDADVKYKCQVQLMFVQDRSTTQKGRRPLTAEISFRIDETATTITRAKIAALAQKIRTTLATGAGYSWDKGKIICWYKDAERGYDLQIYALSKPEGEQVIKKILDIQNHPWDADKFKHTTPERDSDNTPGTVTILGESTDKPRWRPSALVRFSYANLIVWNRKEPIRIVSAWIVQK